MSIINQNFELEIYNRIWCGVSQAKVYLEFAAKYSRRVIRDTYNTILTKIGSLYERVKAKVWYAGTVSIDGISKSAVVNAVRQEMQAVGVTPLEGDCMAKAESYIKKMRKDAKDNGLVFQVTRLGLNTGRAHKMAFQKSKKNQVNNRIEKLKAAVSDVVDFEDTDSPKVTIRKMQAAIHAFTHAYLLHTAASDKANPWEQAKAKAKLDRMVKADLAYVTERQRRIDLQKRSVDLEASLKNSGGYMVA